MRLKGRSLTKMNSKAQSRAAASPIACASSKTSRIPAIPREVVSTNQVRLVIVGPSFLSHTLASALRYERWQNVEVTTSEAIDNTEMVRSEPHDIPDGYPGTPEATLAPVTEFGLVGAGSINCVGLPCGSVNYKIDLFQKCV